MSMLLLLVAGTVNCVYLVYCVCVCIVCVFGNVHWLLSGFSFQGAT
jgi:hypothetical protein